MAKRKKTKKEVRGTANVWQKSTRHGEAKKTEKRSTRHGEGPAKKYETRRRHTVPSDTIAYSGIAEGTWAPQCRFGAKRGVIFVKETEANGRFGIHFPHPPDCRRGPQVGAREPCAHFPDDARSTRQTPSNYYPQPLPLARTKPPSQSQPDQKIKIGFKLELCF